MKYLKWTPTNSVEYSIMLTQLPADMYGQKAGTWMAIGPWVDRAKVLFIPPGEGVLDYNTVCAKFDLGPHDASVITLMLAPHVGRTPHVLPNLFEHYPNQRGEPTVTEFP
jgi:hypothetical protein